MEKVILVCIAASLVVLLAFRIRHTFHDTVVHEFNGLVKYLAFPVLIRGYGTVAAVVYSMVILPIDIIALILLLVGFNQSVILVVLLIATMATLFLAVVAEQLMDAFKYDTEGKVKHILAALAFFAMGVYGVVYMLFKLGF